jgi:Ca2+-binding RTX toxin-like protein
LSALALVASFAIIVPGALAAVVVAYSAGELTVTGDGAGNTVFIAVNNSGQVTVNGDVVDDGGSPVPADDVTSISVGVGAGADHFDLRAILIHNLDQLTVNLGSGNDRMFAGQTGFGPTVVLNGGSGDDTITVRGVRSDQIDGGSGTDTFRVLGDGRRDFLEVDNNLVAGSRLTNIRNVVFNGAGEYDLVRIHQHPSDRVFTFIGGGGTDELSVGTSARRADHVRGRITMRGGRGRNFARFDFRNSPVPMDLELGPARNGDLLLARNGDLRFRDLHALELLGSPGKDTLSTFGRFAFPPGPPSSEHDFPETPLTIFGMGERDILNLKDVAARTTWNLGAGHDRATGGTRKDSMLGQAGNDILMGRRGRDVLFGGDHTDKCYGGRGADVFGRCETREQ